MNKRTRGFLSEEFIDHDSEQFKYIKELHEYLWRFVRVHLPGAGGKLEWYLDKAIEKAEKPLNPGKNLLTTGRNKGGVG